MKSVPVFPHLVILSCLLFSLGMPAGWLLAKHGNDFPSANASKMPLRPARPKPDSRHKSPSAAESLANRICKGGQDFAPMSEAKNLPPETMKDFLEALIRHSGPDGVNLTYREDLRALIADWAKADFNTAWTWAAGCDNEAWAHYVRTALLEGLVELDPERALSLELEEIRNNPVHKSRVIPRLFEAKALQGAKPLLDFIESLPKRNLTVSFGGINDFPESFDFRQLMDGLAHYRSETESNRPAYLPSSPMQVWAARDPDAAAQWWIENPSSEAAKWGDMLDAVHRKRGIEEASRWAAEKFNAADASARSMMVEQLADAHPTGVINRAGAILSHIGDSNTREAFASEFVVKQGLGWAGGLEYATMLTEVGSRERRIEVLQNLAARRGFVPSAQNIPDWLLNQWELSREEVSHALQVQ